MALFEIATLSGTFSATTANFIYPSFSGATRLLYYRQRVAITQRRPNNLAKDGRMVNGGTDEKRGGGEEDVGEAMKRRDE